MELREAIEAFKARKISWRELDPDIITIILNAVEVGTLIPADAVFQIREGYRVSSRLGAYMDVPLSEALTIRSADDVRREAVQYAAYRLRHEYVVNPNQQFSDAIEWVESLIDTPQPKHDQKCPDCKGTGMRDSGGVYPWGEGIFVSCDCDTQPKGGDDE